MDAYLYCTAINALPPLGVHLFHYRASLSLYHRRRHRQHHLADVFAPHCWPSGGRRQNYTGNGLPVVAQFNCFVLITRANAFAAASSGGDGDDKGGDDDDVAPMTTTRHVPRQVSCVCGYFDVRRSAQDPTGGWGVLEAEPALSYDELFVVTLMRAPFARLSIDQPAAAATADDVCGRRRAYWAALLQLDQ